MPWELSNFLRACTSNLVLNLSSVVVDLEGVHFLKRQAILE